MIRKGYDIIVRDVAGTQEFRGTVLEASPEDDIIVFRLADGTKRFLHTGIDHLDDGHHPIPGRFLVAGYKKN